MSPLEKINQNCVSKDALRKAYTWDNPTPPLSCFPSVVISITSFHPKKRPDLDDILDEHTPWQGLPQK